MISDFITGLKHMGKCIWAIYTLINRIAVKLNIIFSLQDRHPTVLIPCGWQLHAKSLQEADMRRKDNSKVFHSTVL